jgi:hypothetical protein
MDWNYLAQNRDLSRALLDAIIDFRDHMKRTELHQLLCLNCFNRHTATRRLLSLLYLTSHCKMPMRL